LIVDDGLATGSSMRAAVPALKQRDASATVVAVPIAPPDTCALLECEADATICARTPEPLVSVGSWYEDFTETTDDEVRTLLERAHASGKTEP
jgi:putative phosphoribosyl transferase